MYRSICLLILLSTLHCNTTSPATQDLGTFTSDFATASDDLAAASPDQGGSAADMAGSAPVRVCSADNWCWENPLPQSNTLYGLWGANANNAWAVGSYGTILKWNGTGWAAQPSGVTEDLRGVWGADANNVWAVGSRTLLKWDGNTWTAQAAGATGLFNAVWGTDANNVWAIGAQGVVLKWNGASSGHCGRVFPGLIWRRRIWEKEHYWHFPIRSPGRLVQLQHWRTIRVYQSTLCGRIARAV